MSRIGKKPVILPNGVEVKISGQQVTINGPKGTLIVDMPPKTSVTETPEHTLEVSVVHQDDAKERAQWGLARQLLANAVAGVQKPYDKSLEFNGVGFRIAVEGKNLKMEVGFSHPVIFPIPEGIQAAVEKQILTLSGIDKQLVGETAARIRRIRPPEPYKGKGIKYTTETIRRKAGKTATKA